VFLVEPFEYGRGIRFMRIDQGDPMKTIGKAVKAMAHVAVVKAVPEGLDENGPIEVMFVHELDELFDKAGPVRSRCSFLVIERVRRLTVRPEVNVGINAHG